MCSKNLRENSSLYQKVIETCSVGLEAQETSLLIFKVTYICLIQKYTCKTCYIYFKNEHVINLVAIDHDLSITLLPKGRILTQISSFYLEEDFDNGSDTCQKRRRGVRTHIHVGEPLRPLKKLGFG